MYSVNVGGGLPPMRECQLVDLVLTHCNRGQVESSHRPSHIWISIYQLDLGLLLLWLLILILGAPSNTLAERRLESVGNPAGRRVSRAGPRMAHDGGPRIQAGVRAHRA